MKYIVILADGMADEPLDALSGKTPLEYANTPVMDMLASQGQMGMVRTVPDGMKPGSDVANLSVLGYDPRLQYTGRSPLEALSIGVSMKPEDVAFRCNLVTLSEPEPYGQKRLLDHSAGEISTQDADVLMDAVRQAFSRDGFSFYTGTSYRQIMIWEKGTPLELEPPHDHLGATIGPFLPQDPVFREMMEKSFEILNSHPLNIRRARDGRNKANSLWFWGAGTKPELQDFRQKTGLSGAMISAVDLLKGIALAAGMEVIRVPGATGSLHTNYRGKSKAATEALLKKGHDFVYVHIEAPDEMGHQGSIANKIASIENIDAQIVAPVVQEMDASGEPYRILILPDHPTPVRCRTHTAEPVPYLIYDSRWKKNQTAGYSEREARNTGCNIADGYKLIDLLTGGERDGKSL